MRKVTTENQQAAADILAAAFASDPFMLWLSPKPNFLSTLYPLILPALFEKGVCYMTAENDGVAIWMTPGQQLKFPRSLSTLIRFTRAAGFSALWKLDKLFFSKGIPTPTEHYYYLFLLGKSPESQRNGVGSELLKHMLERCDEEQVPAFLENSNVNNLPFYQKHGFTLLGSKPVVPNGPTLWYMWREPNTLA
ncbi:GNAT family N-acetyltransferase [Rubritalea marina]|uniref:GNAT family N-acetyltransferase n=1 Tax=Rubritalea marina TaxID=361055 RepID=UPI0003723836|nr:GNAT family N-acetyltransferase [Rubritalea marina]